MRLLAALLLAASPAAAAPDEAARVERDVALDVLERFATPYTDIDSVFPEGGPGPARRVLPVSDLLSMLAVGEAEAKDLARTLDGAGVARFELVWEGAVARGPYPELYVRKARLTCRALRARGGPGAAYARVWVMRSPHAGGTPSPSPPAEAPRATAPGGPPSPPAPADFRLLVNLARSAIGDALFELQKAFDGRQARWHDWAILGRADERTVEPAATRESLRQGGLAGYDVDDVKVVRARVVPQGAGFGLVDLRATARAGTAALTLVARHTLDLTDGLPFPGGRVVELSPTAVATTLAEGAPLPGAARSPEETLAVVLADLLQGVQKRDVEGNATVRVGRTQTQVVVAEPAPDGTVSGRLVTYRWTPEPAPRRLVRRLATGSAELPARFESIDFGMFEGAGGPFVRATLRPASPRAGAPRPAPLTALLRASGPEMLKSDLFDWSFMDPLAAVRYLKPDE